MRVEAPPVRGGPRLKPERGFSDALGRAEGRQGPPRRAGAAPAATAAPAQVPILAPAVPPAAFLTAAGERGAELAGPGASPVAVRAVAALEVLRLAERTQVEIAAGEELRYRLSQTALGVEIRARVAPDLERVARAHLHSVADALRRRGVRLARAQVHLAPRSRDAAGR